MDNFETVFADVISDLQERYSSTDESTVQQIVEDSAYVYLFLRNVPDTRVDAFVFSKKEINWVKRCATEILERGDFYGVQSYSENGYAVSYFADTISSTLKRQVFPLMNTLSEANFHSSGS